MALYSTLVAVLGLVVWVGAVASKDLIVRQQYSAEREVKEVFSYDKRVEEMKGLRSEMRYLENDIRKIKKSIEDEKGSPSAVPQSLQVSLAQKQDAYEESKKQLEKGILEIAEVEKFVSADRGSTIARAYYVENKILIVGYSVIVMFALLNFIEFFSTLNNYIGPKKNV